MADIKRSIRIDEELWKDIKNISEEQNYTNNFIIETALKQFRDAYYMQNKATIINEEIINILKSTINVSEHRINFKTNKYLSELAIQTVITNLIIAKSLEISDDEVNLFRLKALDFLKENQRVLRLEELID